MRAFIRSENKQQTKNLRKVKISQHFVLRLTCICIRLIGFHSELISIMKDGMPTPKA